MAVCGDPTYLVTASRDVIRGGNPDGFQMHTLRKTLLAMDDALLTRVVSVASKSDNDYILTSSASAPSSASTATTTTTTSSSSSSAASVEPRSRLFRPRERRRRERAIGLLADRLALASSSSSSSSAERKTDSYRAEKQETNDTVQSVLAAARFSSTSTNNDDDDDASEAGRDPADGLIWTSISARSSEARFSWAINAPQPQTVRFADNVINPPQKDPPDNTTSNPAELILQPRGGFLERRAVADASHHHNQRMHRFSGIRKNNVSTSEKQAYAPLRSGTPPVAVRDSSTSNNSQPSASFAGSSARTSSSSSHAPSSTPSIDPLFAKTPVPLPGSATAQLQPKKSALALLLNDQGATENPFAEEFGVLSGKGEAYPIRIKIYIPTSPTPEEPMLIIVKRDATVEELIGYTLYEYFNKLSNDLPDVVETLLPGDKRDVCCWNLRLVEDDGTIDDDFPALDRVSKMQRSNFDALALCLCTPSQIAVNQAARQARPASNRNRPTPQAGILSAAASAAATTSGIPTSPMGSRTGAIPLSVHAGNAPSAFAPSITTGSSSNPSPAMARTFSSNPTSPTRTTAPLPPLPPGAPSSSNPGTASAASSGAPLPSVAIAAGGPPLRPQIFIKIHLYSTLEVKQTTTFAFTGDTRMAEVFETICRRRHYDPAHYVLKMADTRTDVPPERALEDVGSVEFCVLKKDRGGAGDIFLRPPGESTPTAAGDVHEFSREEIEFVYRQYSVTQRQLMGRNERLLTLDGEYVHVMSVGEVRGNVNATASFHVSALVSCLLLRRQGRQFRLTVAKGAGGVGPGAGAAIATSFEFEAASEAQAGESVFEPVLWEEGRNSSLF
ncbi:stress-activated map kinase interacting protein 1-domain-containing protein [Chytriomyces sp. MP71]|nr:stress-activated map kinase interacting protein 1-domain-containing protein [Chytriomyces sp. MP71]